MLIVESSEQTALGVPLSLEFWNSDFCEAQYTVLCQNALDFGAIRTYIPLILSRMHQDASLLEGL